MVQIQFRKSTPTRPLTGLRPQVGFRPVIALIDKIFCVATAADAHGELDH